MAVIKYDDLKRQAIEMEGVAGVSKAVAIGQDEGWEGHTLRVFRLEANCFTPHHEHDWEHVNYIMKGKGELVIGDKVNQVAQGDFAFVPPNTKHQFRNPNREAFEFICIVPNRGEY